jgi:hypothetical protein
MGLASPGLSRKQPLAACAGELTLGAQMKEEWFGFPLMAAGVAGIGVGGRMASGGENVGWIGVLGGIALLMLSYFLMRTVADAPASGEAPASAAATSPEE